jgi:photosystem II stability/assembly factor-like uncharacterized protein
VKKIYLSVLVVLAIGASYVIYAGHNPAKPLPYFGDVDALGSEDDANARYTYELMQLRDPATGKIPAHIRERELAFAASLPNDGAASPTSRSTALSWQSRGPWNVGGRTRAFAIDVSSENNLVAGSTSGGMWRSRDRGASWHSTTPSNTYKSVSCLAQDTRPGHTNVWYYGTGEAYGTSASATGAFYLGNGIYKSTDSGETWTLLPATTSAHLTTLDVWGDLIWNIVVDPTNGSVYAAAYGAVYKSTDGGTTWASVLGSFSSSYFTDIAISRTGVLYATLSSDGGSRGLYRSPDGTTFTKITPDSFALNYNRLKIGISPDNENQVYFLGNTPGYGFPDTSYVGAIEWNSLWRYTYIAGNGSGDTGGFWQNRSANLPSAGGVFDKFTCQGSYDLVVKVKPGDTNVVFIGGTNLYRSNSAFADKSHTTYIGGYQHGASLPVVNLYLNHHPDQHELAFFPSDPNHMISTNDGGIFYCNDNTVNSVLWTSLNNGYISTMFYSCAIDHAGTGDIVIGGAQDNGSWFTNSSDVHIPWVTPRGGDGSYCAIADAGKSYYFSIQNGRIMRAKVDGSGVVDSFARIDPIGGFGYQFINPFILDPNDNNIMYMAAGRSLWRNNNLSGIPYAGNWDSISTNWFRLSDSASTLGAGITCVTACKAPANRVYFGTSSRLVFRIDSANTGNHVFKSITSTTKGSFFPSNGNVSCIAVDPANGDHAIVVFSNYAVNSLFYTSDGGATWSKIGGNLEANNVTGAGDAPSCRWASIVPVSNGYVYLVGTSVGLFATTQLRDTSTVWVQQGTNTIGASVTTMMDARSTDGLVVVATHSGGIYSSHIVQVADINGVKEVPAGNAGFSFLNYPNPFTNQTTIQFSLDYSTNVSIRVFDQSGRLVSIVANEQMNAGTQKYVFSANNLAPGIYYCNIKTGLFSETNKLVLVK